LQGRVRVIAVSAVLVALGVTASACRPDQGGGWGADPRPSGTTPAPVPSGPGTGPSPVPTVTATTSRPAPTTTPTRSPTMPVPPIPAGFPNAANTGVPDGTPLTPYTGPCTITTANQRIDAKLITCDLSIRATGVEITRSRIIGTVEAAEGSRYSFTLTDSEVHATPNEPKPITGVTAANFLVLRSEITGGNQEVYCGHNCEVRDSWIHGTKVAGDWHASAVRASQGSRIIHNTLACDTKVTPQDGGCSADLTMYGDFEPVRDVTVEGNLFVANLDAAFCAYGGSSPTKPYSNDAANVVFRSNVFQRGKNRGCGAYGPVDSLDLRRPGNAFVNNVWDSGEPVKL
jgi:hypothetical protein